MTKTEKQKLALALLHARPAVVPGTNTIIDDVQRKLWYACVTQIALVAFPDNGNPSNADPSWFFDTAGVPN